MQEKRTILQYLGITLRGIGMGAADVVPGVSGGTIAFITGIYEELITSISNINLDAFKKLKEEGIRSAWKHVNGNFFVALISGIAIAALSLSRVITYLLDNQPILVWSFFFGLILGSIQLILKDIKKWDLLSVLGLLAGTGIAAYISLIHSVGTGGSLWYIFLSGAIGICAMILPGISGAFILVLMGSYRTIMDGIKNFDIVLIAVFAFGCLVGILSFSRLLKYLFKHYENLVLMILSGFLVGSLLTIWPWKNPIGDAPVVIHSDGKEDWMMGNVLPADYIGDSLLFYALLAALIGYLLIVVMAKFAPKNSK